MDITPSVRGAQGEGEAVHIPEHYHMSADVSPLGELEAGRNSKLKFNN